MSAGVSLFLVCVAYGLMQVLLFGAGRALEWDEAVYWTQVLSGLPDAGYFATRSFGVLWLAWPAALVSESTTILRGYLAMASSGLLYVAFRPWTVVVGKGAAIAAAMVACFWPAIYYGTVLSPNLPAALALVGVLGYCAVLRLRPAWSAAAMVVGLGWFAIVLRPPDAVLALVCFGVVFVVSGQWRIATYLICAGVLGIGAWVVESLVLFDGPLSRLTVAAAHVEPKSSGLTMLVDQLHAYDAHQLLGRPRRVNTPMYAVATWFLILVSAVGGVTMGAPSWPKSLRPALLAGFLASVVLIVFYITRVSIVAPRFLLPAFALLLPAAGLFLARLWARSNRRLGAILVLPLLVPFVYLSYWSVGTAAQIHKGELKVLQVYETVGRQVAQLAQGAEACLVAGQYGGPQLVFYSRCHPFSYNSGTNQLHASTDVKKEVKRAGTHVYFVAAKAKLERKPPFKGWRILAIPGHSRWKLLQPKSPADVSL